MVQDGRHWKPGRRWILVDHRSQERLDQDFRREVYCSAAAGEFLEAQCPDFGSGGFGRQAKISCGADRAEFSGAGGVDAHQSNRLHVARGVSRAPRGAVPVPRNCCRFEPTPGALRTVEESLASGGGILGGKWGAYGEHEVAAAGGGGTVSPED